MQYNQSRLGINGLLPWIRDTASHSCLHQYCLLTILLQRLRIASRRRRTGRSKSLHCFANGDCQLSARGTAGRGVSADHPPTWGYRWRPHSKASKVDSGSSWGRAACVQRIRIALLKLTARPQHPIATTPGLRSQSLQATDLAD